MRVIDYDEIEQWQPWLTAMVSSIAPAELLEALETSRLKYMEDALDYVVENIGRPRLVEHLNSELAPYSVRLYHGTRVIEAELRQIRTDGLRPLRLSDRRMPLAAVFRQHPEWSTEKEQLLDEQLYRRGPGWKESGYARREDGSVHVCLSRAGLLLSCNHYLRYGAEVDQDIANVLFPDGSGLELLRRGRAAKLVSFTAAFGEAAKAANPYGLPEYELPDLLRKLLSAWAYKTAKPRFSVAKECDPSSLTFKGCIPPGRLEIVDVEDAELAESDATV
jgi:hypothetical protein